MLELKEELLQFAWQHKLLRPGPYLTASEKEIDIIKPGDLNRDSGPDFFNAQIKLEGITLAGNIEVHIKTSDWLKHNHQNDKSYDTIILHVVYVNDIELPQNKNNNVEVLEIKNLLPQHLISQYRDIISSKNTIACNNQLANVDDLKFSSWLQRMSIERLEFKIENIESLFNSFNGDYTQTFYTVLLRNFGFKVNSVPFELLAKQLPITTLLKHSDNILQLEALLLGSSGLLENQFEDKYVLKLQNEFEYLKNKYGLIPLKKELFKFSKLRPANFATLRLAQVAQLIHTRPLLFSAPQQFDSYEKIKACLNLPLDGYWKNHYNLDGNLLENQLQLGDTSIANIITNTFANFFFFYFKKTGRVQYEELPLQLMEQCAFEKNAKTRHFEKKKHQLKNAADSQGLIHLHDNYCTKRKCLDCGIATAILK